MKGGVDTVPNEPYPDIILDGREIAGAGLCTGETSWR